MTIRALSRRTRVVVFIGMAVALAGIGAYMYFVVRPEREREHREYEEWTRTMQEDSTAFRVLLDGVEGAGCGETGPQKPVTGAEQ